MIDSYRFGGIIVNGVEYTKDLVIFPDHVKSNWWRIEGHKLHLEDIQDVLNFMPKIFVVGKGAYGFMKITKRVEKALSDRGIQVVARKTREACEMYNSLVNKEDKIVAALHITC